MLSLLILGGAFVASLNTITTARATQLTIAERRLGLAMAQDLMDEILAHDTYTEGTLGLDAGEKLRPRSNYDDLNDYHNYNSARGQMQDIDGNDIPGTEGYTRRVSMHYVDPDNLTVTRTADTGVTRDHRARPRRLADRRGADRLSKQPLAGAGGVVLMSGRTPRKPVSDRRRRGTAYVLVLAITSLLITLGIAATQLARGEIRQGELESEQAEARYSALSAIDIVHARFEGTTAWRSTYISGTWYYLDTLDGSDLFILLFDQTDNDLADANDEPFLLYVAAINGNTRRIFRIQFTSDDAGDLTRDHGTLQAVTFDDLFG